MSDQDAKNFSWIPAADTPDQQSFVDEREFVGKKGKHNQKRSTGVRKTVTKEKGKPTVGSGGCYPTDTSRARGSKDPEPSESPEPPAQDESSESEDNAES